MSATGSAASASSSGLELLLHSLSHEHNAQYVDRHVLLLEKWTRDYAEGLYIRDLPYVMSVFAVLRDRLATHPGLFREVLSSVLQVCSLPLFEVKANERLRQSSVDAIMAYMLEICMFWVPGDAVRNAEIARCFRCIVNGGVDPTTLKVDLQKWVSEDGLRVQVTDRVYLQKLLRESGAVDFLVDAFNTSSEDYRRDFALANSTISNNNGDSLDSRDVAACSRSNSAAAAAAAATDDDDSDNENAGPVAPRIPRASSSVAAGDSPTEATKQALANSQELCKALTALCIELTEDSKTACAMCSRRVSDGAVRLLDVGSQISLRDPSVSPNVDLIWTVADSFLQQAQPPSLSNDAKIKNLLAQEVMDFEAAVGVLMRIFEQLLQEGYRLADKECRNEILVVLSMIASFPASFPAFMCSGALNTLLTYACITEMGPKAWAFYTKPLANFRNFASISDIDLQLKREIWMAITEVLQSNDADALLCTASSPILDMLMAYVEFDTFESPRQQATSLEDESATLPSRLRGGGSSMLYQQSSQAPTAESTDGGPLGFNPSSSIEQGPSSVSVFEAPTIPTHAGDSHAADKSVTQIFLHSLPLGQLRELQVLAMTFLAENTPKMTGEYLRIGGPVRILDVLFRYSRSNVPEHKALVYASLLLLNRCLVCSDIVKRLMELENGAQTFMYIFQHTDEDRTQALSARLVAILCADRNELCQQQVRVKNGIHLLVGVVAAYATHRKVQVGRRARIKMLHSDEGGVSDPEASDAGDIDLLIVAVLDCISKVVVANRRSEAQFCKDEGVDSLLLLLEISPFLLRAQVLRLLADLLNNKQLLTFVHAWRSPKTMRSATQLFAHCWMDEEARLGVSRERGVICDIWNPLGNHTWPVDDVNQADGESLSSSGSVGTSARSLAVTRLSEAISSSRAQHGLIPENVLRQVLDCDTRGILARILSLVGAIDNYANAMSPDFRVSHYFQNIYEGEYEGSPMYQNAKEGEPEEKGVEQGEEQRHAGLKKGALEASVQGDDDEEQDDDRPERPRIVATGGNNLQPADNQVVAIAQQYSVLRSGEWWHSVAEQLRDDAVKPIETDLALMESHLSASFDAAFLVQTEQMELHALEVGLSQTTETNFNEAIMSKKEAAIKAGYLRKFGSAKGR